MISLNVPGLTGKEQLFISKVFKSRNFSGNNEYSRLCVKLLKNITCAEDIYLTSSATQALEVIAYLLDIKPGDEIIMPSYTFVSTANAFALKGAKIIFVDIRPDTMNIDENKIEDAITEHTKAIVAVHYAGVACNMDKIMSLAKKYNLYVVEDAAQCIGSKYKGKHLGTIGDFGCISFHETKNIHCGEGGALLINNKKFLKKAKIFCENGTNRSEFLEGKTDKYTWQSLGLKCYLNEITSAFLYAQLQDLENINKQRLKLWKLYYDSLEPLARRKLLDLPVIPQDCEHNAHIFYIKTKNKKQRDILLNFLKKNEIETAFHFIPLHSSPAGKRFGVFIGKDEFTSKESDRLLRLPLHNNLDEKQVKYVVEKIKEFMEENN